MIDPTADAAIEAFGEAVQLVRPGGDIPLQAVFSRPRALDAVARYEPQLFVTRTTVAAHAIARDDTIRVRGTVYRIAELIEDDGEGVTLPLIQVIP